MNVITRQTWKTLFFLLVMVCSQTAISASEGNIESSQADRACKRCGDFLVEEVVVTGTRTVQLQIDSPVRVELVTAEDIERKHALDLSEAIDSLPGVNIRPIRGKEGVEAWLQGISANRVLILVDGEVVSASTGSAVDLTQVATGHVERVEVVKGATSVLYGSAAMGGVINVITREPEDGLNFSFNVDAGSYGTQNTSGNEWALNDQRLNTSLQYKTEQFFIYTSLTARFSDGWSLDPGLWNQQGADGHKINARAVVRYSVSDDHYYQLSYEAYDQEQYTRFTEWKAATPIRHAKQDNAEREHLAFKAYWAADTYDVTLNGFDEVYINESVPVTNLFRYADFTSNKLSGLWNLYDLPSQTLTLGFDFFEETLEQYKQEDGEVLQHELQGSEQAARDSIELFFQDEVSIGPLTLLPGVRWQKDSDFGTHLTPKLNFRWDILDTEQAMLFVRGGVGEGYRVSNLKERHYIFDHSHIGYIITGNPELSPETSTSYQLGLVYADLDSYQLDVNIFYNDLSDLIEVVYSYQDGEVGVYQYGNVDQAVTKGVELNGAFQLHHQLKWQAGYVYLEAEDKGTGLRLKDRPRHQIKTTLDYTTDDGLRLSFIASWQDDEVDETRGLTSPAWYLYHIKFDQDVSDTVSLYGGIDNLSNTQKDFMSEYDNRPEQGRYVYLGFKYTY